MYKFLFSIVLFLSIQIVAEAQRPPHIPGSGVSGTTTITPKEKKPKIKYQFHRGEALVKTGLKLVGKFKYIDSKNDVPQFLFIEEGTKKKKYVALSMIDRMTLVGAEKGITARKDSTEFVWIDKYNDIYRKVRGGKVQLYDNSRIVDESYEFLTDYLLLADKEDVDVKLVRQLSDLQPFMMERPYFMKSAKASGRYNTKDFRVVIFMVDLYNDPNPLKVLKWNDVAIELRNGKKITGKGYLQPLDMRNEYVPSKNGYVHFHDGKDFNIYSNTDIRKLTYKGVAHKQGMYGLVSKNFYGTPWVNDEIEYLIARRIITNNNYFFKPRYDNGQDIVILKKVGNDYIKPLSEPQLKRTYIQELKDKANSTMGSR